MPLANLLIERQYSSDKESGVSDFYNNCLEQSERYDRGVGFFSSSIYLINGEAVIDFAKRGGKIRLLCSHKLSLQDVEAIKQGTETYEKIVIKNIELEIDNLINQSKEFYPIRVLATLISVGAMEIKIALRKNPNTMYHQKIGIFKDNLNCISFKGSSNDSYIAFADNDNGNYEDFDVFCSWKPEDLERTKDHQREFEELWSEKKEGLIVKSFPEALQMKFIEIAESDFDSIDRDKLNKSLLKKSFPSQIKTRKIDDLRDHQKIAIGNWKENDCVGILQHATGSGKTITAIYAINEHIESNGVALILVPSALLHSQWVKEINNELGSDQLSLLKVGIGNNSWRENDRLKRFVSNQYKGEGIRIVLSTMQTACQEDFINSFEGIDNLMLIADEVHQIGSSNNSNSLLINAKKRMGLSATPTRYGDPDGTSRIFSYFSKIIEPVVTLNDAIKSGALVEYEYYPHLINLTATEADEWKLISLQIRKEMAISNQGNEGKLKLSQRAKNLLISRSRIAKKSATKLTLVSNVMEEYYVPGEKWLIYCADKDQMKKVTEILNNKNITSYEYYSDMSSDNKEVLNLFQLKGGVLVSIKCLDEGVDIPAISHALILASSMNPREFIQRRGRVLRRYPGKTIAKIHDAIITPISLESEPEQLSLLKSEFIRSYEFSRSAINKMAGHKLFSAATELGINISELIEDGYEEETLNDD